MSLGWMLKAACRGSDWQVFFPEHGSGRAPGDALRFCAECDVRWQCLEYALDIERGKASELRAGVYGGTLPYQRARMKGAG